MTEREVVLQRLGWSLEHLDYLRRHPQEATPERLRDAWGEHLDTCRHLTRINDGARR